MSIFKVRELSGLGFQNCFLWCKIVFEKILGALGVQWWEQANYTKKFKLK